MVGPASSRKRPGACQADGGNRQADSPGSDIGDSPQSVALFDGARSAWRRKKRSAQLATETSAWNRPPLLEAIGDQSQSLLLVRRWVEIRLAAH